MHKPWARVPCKHTGVCVCVCVCVNLCAVPHLDSHPCRTFKLNQLMHVKCTEHATSITDVTL